MRCTTRSTALIAAGVAGALAGPASAQLDWDYGYEDYGYFDSDYYDDRYYRDGAYDEAYMGDWRDGYYDQYAPEYYGDYEYGLGRGYGYGGAGYGTRYDTDIDQDRYAYDDDDDFYDGSVYDTDDWKGSDREFDYYDKGWYTVESTDQDRWYEDQRTFYGEGPDDGYFSPNRLYTSDEGFEEWYDRGVFEGEGEHGHHEPGDQSWFDGQDWWQDE